MSAFGLATLAGLGDGCISCSGSLLLGEVMGSSGSANSRLGSPDSELMSNISGYDDGGTPGTGIFP